MTKLQRFREVYKIRGWVVTIERIENGSVGQPRFEVQIFDPKLLDDCGFEIASTFHFQGHYLAVKDEAKWALEQYFKYLSKKYGK